MFQKHIKGKLILQSALAYHSETPIVGHISVT